MIQALEENLSQKQLAFAHRDGSKSRFKTFLDLWMLAVLSNTIPLILNMIKHHPPTIFTGDSHIVGTIGPGSMGCFFRG